MDLGGQSGATQTDSRGYGQFSAVSRKSTKDKRLILHMGPQFVALTANEITKIVLPQNFCRDDHR